MARAVRGPRPGVRRLDAALNSVRRLRPADAARSLGTVERLANVFMRSLGEGRSESLLILPSFTAPVRRRGATARRTRSNLKAVIRRPDHPGARRAVPGASSPHSERQRCRVILPWLNSRTECARYSDPAVVELAHGVREVPVRRVRRTRRTGDSG